MATWAEAGLVTAADLLADDEDPHPGAGGLIARSVATLHAAGVTCRPRVRGDVGYFAADIAWAAVNNGCDFSLGVTRNAAAWRAAAAIADGRWTPAVGMKGAQVGVAPHAPAGWPPDTACVVRRVVIPAGNISADPRARKRRTINPARRDQLKLSGIGPQSPYARPHELWRGIKCLLPTLFSRDLGYANDITRRLLSQPRSRLFGASL